MLRRISYLLVLLLATTLGQAQGLKQYEYWMDSDYSKHTMVKGNQTDITFDIDISQLGYGIHYLNFRAQNDAGDWGTFSRYLYFIPQDSSPDATVTDFEYWIDGDYGQKQGDKVSDGNLVLSLDISSLPYGMHYLNFRAKNSDGVWGNLSRYLFFVSETASADATVTAYEYWLDNDYSSRQSAQVTDVNIALSVDVNALASGVHYFNFRAQNSDGVWGNLSRYLFFVPDHVSKDATVTDYEYWLDDAYASKASMTAGSNQFTASIDVSQMASGMHYLNFRAKNSDGVWGNLSRYLVYIPSDTGETGSPIVGYRYGFNRHYTYVPITDRTEYELSNFVVEFPKLKEVGSLEEGCQYSFDHQSMKARLERNANVGFAIQFKNKVGDWSAPAATQIELSDTIEKTIRQLPVQKTVTFDKVATGDFEAFEIEINEYKDYYFKANQSCKIQLYDENGLLLTTMDSTSLLNTAQIALTQGKYYGIVYDMVKDEANSSDQLVIKLMLTKNIVPTPVITYENETVSITCLQEGAAIYYTLDGTEPTRESTVYTAPFPLKRNAIIRVVATYNDMADSDIAELTVDSYKVQMPSIEFANLLLYMSCETEGASIYYTLDGTDPNANGERYLQPVAITTNCVVKAVGKREGYNNSEAAILNIDVSNVKTAIPTVTREDNGLVVTSRTEGARFYYTTDGSMPTTSSSSTDRLIQPERNCTVTVIAAKDGEIPSDPVQFVVDWLKVATPSLVFANGQLTISCGTPEAIIYYEIGDMNPTRASKVYTTPLTLTDNRPVKAFAAAEDLIDSDVALYNPSSFTCEKPVIAFDGYHLNISTATEGATIHYTTDGSTPGSSSPIYGQTILVHSVMTIKAIAMKENTNSSEFAEFTVPAYYDGIVAEVGIAGALSQAFAWCDTESVDKLEVKGTLSLADLAWLKMLTGLQHLDLAQASIEGNSLPDEAFENMPIVSITVPAGISSVGSKLFQGCKRLAAIMWNPNTKLTEQALTGVNNPNILLYVNIASDAPASVRNVVVNGMASNIVLTDADGNNNFYCPKAFTAANISYTHNYSMTTGINECRGWETLALPFDVQQIAHSHKGSLAPFGYSDDDLKQFWLCK